MDSQESLNGKKINIMQLAYILEDQVTSRYNNKSLAVRLFREAGVLQNDFRSEKAISDSLGYISSRFRKSAGRIKLTATSMGVGKIVADILQVPDQTEITWIRLGDFIIDILLDADFMVMERDEFRTAAEVISRYDGVKTKKKATTYPWYLEIRDFMAAPISSHGLHMHRPPLWRNYTRKVDGEVCRLVKTREHLPNLTGEEGFLESINHLEGVRYSINPKIAALGLKFKDELLDTKIMLTDVKGNVVMFDARDIKRKTYNKQWHKKRLLKDGKVFAPHRGSKAKSDLLEAEVIKLQQKVEKVKLVETKAKHQASLDKASEVFEAEQSNWLAKQLCLKTSSKAMRENAILTRVHGDGSEVGWLGYNFYLTYFMDYRGRKYTVESYLTPQSSDFAKAHLMNAKAEELTQEGYEAICVNAANAWNKTLTIEDFESFETNVDYIGYLKKANLTSLSLDKLAIDDRFNYISDHLELIRDICENPKQSKLWDELDKPYLFMSYAYEIIGVLDSVIAGETYESSVITYIDGLNNGTQNLAAMALDATAGSYVGLIPMDIPKDLYVAVASGLIEMNEGTPLGDKLKLMPMKNIRKSVSKRAVMIIAYSAGVMRLGTTVHQDSYESGDLETYGLTRADTVVLGKQIMEVYSSVCTGPIEVMKYLRKLSSYALSEQEKISVSWTAPSGFKVVVAKPYSENNKVRAYLQGNQIGHIYRRYLNDIPMAASITTSVPANFVHSYDASHLSAVVNETAKDEIAMTVVHDSFGCHPNYTKRLLDVTKQTFIDMYSGNVLETARYHMTGGDCKETFDREGDLDLQDLWASDFFFC